MSTTDSVLFPCPRCGQSRIELHAGCTQCGWSHESHLVTVEPKPKSKVMNKAMAYTIGVVTIIPALYAVFFMAVVFVLMISLARPPNVSFGILMVLHIIVAFLSWALIAFYITYLFKTDQVPNDKKALWGVVLFLGSLIAMPIFWYHYIWKPAERGY